VGFSIYLDIRPGHYDTVKLCCNGSELPAKSKGYETPKETLKQKRI
jgi:hypothetical protein